MVFPFLAPIMGFLGTAAGAATITAGASLIGGAMQRNDAKDQQNRANQAQAASDARNAAAVAAANKKNEERFEKLDARNQKTAKKLAKTPVKTKYNIDTEKFLQNAEDAGFNPYTWLMGGGLQGVTTQTVHGANAAAAAQLSASAQWSPDQVAMGAPAPTINIPSMGSVVAGAASAGIGTYLDIRREQSAQLFQERMIERQLQGVQNNPQRISRSFNVPSMVTAGPDVLGAPNLPESGVRTVTSPWPNLWVDPSIPDTAAFEERLGEPGEWIGGIWTGVNDIMYGVTGMTHAERRQTRIDVMGDVQEWLKNVPSPLEVFGFEKRQPNPARFGP